MIQPPLGSEPMARSAVKERRDVHQDVTDRIVAALEQGTAPWVKPWNARGGLPVNATTGRPYNGVNVFLLWLREASEGYTTSRWLTFKQAKAAGGSVMRGQKGTNVLIGYANTIKIHCRDLQI